MRNNEIYIIFTFTYLKKNIIQNFNNIFQPIKSQHFFDILTIRPIKDEVRPGPVHEFCGVVGVKRGVVEPAHLQHGHGESAVEEEADLVPVGHG